MKYDSGTKHLHKDILDALKSMLGKMGLAEIKPYIKGGSPAELREHLKERHGKCKQSSTVTSDRVGFYNCTTQNFNLEFEHLLNNDGDTELTLSWSQVVVFIRNNWDEIYGNEKDKEEEPEQSSPGIEVLEFDVRTYNMLKRDGINTIDELKNSGERLKGRISPTTYDRIFERLDAYCSESVSDTALPETITNSPDTITEDKQITAVFDYSSLENATAAALRDCETVIRKETAGYFTLIGAKLKEAQELLADHSNGTFEQWYTALGFKRQTVYNLIQRYEFISSPTIGGREEAFEGA